MSARMLIATFVASAGLSALVVGTGSLLFLVLERLA